MHKSLFRWRLGAIALLLGLMLAFNGVAIRAQDATEEPPPAVTDAPPTETETPPPAPTDVPTDSPTVEVPTEVPTETEVAPVETEVPTETVTPEETAVATEEPSETPVTETPVVVGPVTPEPPLSLLVRELFDNGDLSPWLAGPGWSLVASETGQALQVVNSNEPIVLQKGAFYNVALQARFLFSTGKAQISVRKTAVGSYTASIDSAGTLTLERGDDIVATSLVAPAAPGAWRSLRVSAINDVIRVSVDNVEVVVYTDVAPLPPGDVSLSADFSAPAGDPNPTPETQTLLADDFFLWVPLAELGLYPAPTQVAPPTQPPATEVPTEVATEVVVVETTPVPTEVVVEPTAEPTVETTATETAPAEVSGPFDDLTQVVGKDVSDVPPPSAQEIANAQGVNNNDFSNRVTATLLGGFYVLNDDNIGSDLESPTEQIPVCGTDLDRTDWFTFTPPAAGTYTFSTAGSSFDTVIAVYHGTTFGSLTVDGCNDDATTSLITSQITLALTVQPYQIQIAGFNGRYGNYSFRVQPGTVPATLAAPVLVLPATGITNNLASPAFKWNKIAANAYSYEIQVATNATFTAGLQSAIVVGSSGLCTATDCTYNSFVLPSPATYYWRVRGRTVNDIGGAFSAPRTYIYRTDAPTLSAPLDNAVVTNARPPLSWVAYPGATYTIEIADNSGFSNPTLFTYSPTGVLASFTSPVPLAPGDWFWHVRATPALPNNGNTAFSAARKFTVNLLSAPAANASTTDTTPMFSWLAATVVSPAPAARYRLEVDRATTFNSTGGSPDYVATNLTTLNNTLPAPLAVIDATHSGGYGKYYWRVLISTDSGATYKLSATNPAYRTLFISPSVPAAPVLVNPAASAFTADTTTLLDWNATTTATGGPFTYDVQVCANATCTTTIYDSTSTAVGVTEYSTAALAPGAYYWRVRTVNAFELASPYSAARMFTVRTFILSTPADNFATVNTKPAFAWLPINYSSTNPAVPVKYQVEVDSSTSFNSNGGNPDYVASGLTTTTHTVPVATPLPFGTYYWRVLISIDGGANYVLPGPAGDYRTIYILSSIPVAPTYPAIPAASAVLADTTPLLDVNDVVPPGGASWTVASYDFQVATNATFTTGLQSFNNAASQFQIVTPLVPGNYFFRARAVTNGGAPGAFSAARAFTIRTLPPVLSAPAPEAISTLVRPTFSWVTYGAGAKYTIEIDDDPGFPSPYTKTAITTTTFAIPAADPALTEDVWYWHVKATDVLGVAQTAFSETRLFYVRTTTALPAPTLNSPATGFVTNPQPTLIWNAVVAPAGVTLHHYQVQVATNAAFTTGLQTSPDVNAPTVQYTTSGLTAGTWYWRVRAFNSNGVPGAFSASRTFIIDTTPLPTAPTQTAPADNASLTIKTPAFTWTKPAGMVKVELRYTTNFPDTPAGYDVDGGLVTPGTVDVNGLTTTTYTPPSPLIPGTYYWQVRGFDAANNPSPWTGLRTFKIISLPGDTPQPNRFGPSDTILLTWGPLSWVTGGGGYYEVEIDNNSNFSSPEYKRTNANGNSINYAEYITVNNYGVVIPAWSTGTPTGLVNGTWYWRVRGFNPAPVNAFGAWSSTGTFVVDK